MKFNSIATKDFQYHEIKTYEKPHEDKTLLLSKSLPGKRQSLVQSTTKLLIHNLKVKVHSSVKQQD